MDYLLGIDIGTNKFTACIYDADHTRVAFASKYVETVYADDMMHPSWSFWQPDYVWDAVKSIIKEVLTQIDASEAVRALSVSGLGYDGLPVGRDGQPLYPIISWHCMRAERQAREFQESFGRKEIFQITGLQAMTCQTIYKILWIRDNLPRIYEKTYKWLMVEDFINYRLCGVMATDRSMASSTSMYDIGRGSWSESLLNSAGIRPDLLVDVLDSGSVLGRISPEICRETGLSCDTLVVLGGHDYMCSALAANSYGPSSVLDIVGSWEMVVAGMLEPKRNDSIYNGGFHVSSQVVPGAYAIVGETVCASMLYWFKNILMERTNLDFNSNNGNIWDNLWLKASRMNPVPNGIFFLPHCSGAVAPIHDSRSLGSFIGLDEAVETCGLVRVLVEGLNFQFMDMLESLSGVMGTKFSKIVCVGEEADNSFLMQNKADVTGMPIEVLGIHSSSAIGACMLAGIGCGVYGSCSEAVDDQRRGRIIYEPNLEYTKAYGEGFHIYKKIYPALKELNWDIFDSFKNR